MMQKEIMMLIKCLILSINSYIGIILEILQNLFKEL